MTNKKVAGVSPVSILNMGKTAKISNGELMKTRNKIFSIFAGMGLTPETGALGDAVKSNHMASNDIASNKIGRVNAYDEEFKRLYKMVVDTFNNAGRPDLAKEFSMSVGPFTSDKHPVDFIATLVKGAGSKIAVKIQEKKYDILFPFAQTMKDSLTAKGISAPSNIEDLTQLFYNNFVAVNSPYNFERFEQMDFLNMKPGHNLDEAVTGAVIAYIKGLQEQKNEGKTLPKVLDKIATTANKVQDELTVQAKAEVSKEVGTKILDNWKVIAVVAVIIVGLLIYFFTRK